MTFLDTSAFYALADTRDANHARAREVFNRLGRSGEELFTHSYILIESSALLHRRLGYAVAAQFLSDAARFSVGWVDARLHAHAVDYFLKHGRRALSFIDCVSFIYMKDMNANRAFAFDDDFKKAGFELVAQDT